jgi:hypothetical protein
MKLHVTPELMELAYEYLRATRPFKAWKLPQADEVEFIVTHQAVTAGHCRSTSAWVAEWKGGKLKRVWHHEIAVSAKMIKRTHNLIETMAHEMVHQHCDRKGVKSHHGAEFMRCCEMVAKVHGFNPAQI